MHPVVTIALRAARSAAETMTHAMDRPDRVKVLDNTPDGMITSLDHDAEKNLVYHLQKAHPDYGIVSTLGTRIDGKDRTNTWLINPLQGTDNFVHGYYHFCVSLALRSGDRITHAVMINPAQGEEFTASRGSGAQLNSTRLRVSKKDSLQHAFVAVAPADRSEKENRLLLGLQQQLQPMSCQIRQSGCAALDIAYVASGKLDAGWIAGLDTETMAAALLILQESGALFSDENANPALQGQELVCGSARTFKQLLQIRQSLAKAQA